MFNVASSSNLPFHCPRCRLEALGEELSSLKVSVNTLTTDMAELKAKLGQMENTTLKASCSPKPTDVPNRPSVPHDPDSRRFNLILFGLTECPTGTPRIERSKHDFECISDILTGIDSPPYHQSVSANISQTTPTNHVPPWSS